MDKAVAHAQDLGMYLGVLPAWGSLVKDRVLDQRNIEGYAEFLGSRFQKYPNIIWILSGDVRWDAGAEVFRKEAGILKKYDPERLITYHPFGRTSSSLWFHEDQWLDFNLFQSGHRCYDQASLGEWDDNAEKEDFFGEDSWRYVERDHGYERMKPTLDGEPSYEGIPQGLHNSRNPYWEEWDVRRYAYWSVFAGAAGHTYGSNAIMQFYDEAEGKGAYGVRESWREAMHQRHRRHDLRAAESISQIPSGNPGNSQEDVNKHSGADLEYAIGISDKGKGFVLYSPFSCVLRSMPVWNLIGRAGGYPRIEACRFEGIVQPFPSHFHEYYVIGFVEKGRRKAPADFLIQAPADEVLFPEKKGL